MQPSRQHIFSPKGVRMPIFAGARSLSLSLSLSLWSSVTSLCNPSASLYGIPLFKGCRFFALPPRVKHSIHSCQKTSVREAHRWSFYYPKSGKYAFLLSESGKGTSRNAPGNVNFLQEEHS